MYGLVLTIHNIVRWIVVILGFVVTARAFYGWFRKKAWVEEDRKIGLFFTISIDLQLLFGLVLYFVYSLWGLKAILDKGISFVMGQGEYRFYAIEHGTFMLLGFILAHLGSALPKKVDDSSVKYRQTAILYGLALILILAGIPWSRPLFP